MKYICFFSVVLIFISCSRENRCDCFKSNSPEVTVIRPLSTFNTIEINSVFDIIWEYDTACFVTITCGKKLAENIITEIISEPTDPGISITKLILKNNNKCNWVRSQEKKIRIVIHSPSFSELRINQPSNFFTSDTIKTQTFTVDNKAGLSTIDIMAECLTMYFYVHAGSGDFTLNGKAVLAYYFNNGNGHFRFNGFKTEYCYFTSSTTGQSYINVTSELGVTISGKGNVYYTGNPYKIEKIEDNEGKLIKAD